MLAITNQNVTPEEKSSWHKTSHFKLIGKFQQQEWKMLGLISRTQTFSRYKQQNKPSCLQNKCYLLTGSLVISRVINLLEEKSITLNLHQSPKSTIYVKESLGQYIWDKCSTCVNQIPSISKRLNYLAQWHGMFALQKLEGRMDVSPRLQLKQKSHGAAQKLGGEFLCPVWCWRSGWMVMTMFPSGLREMHLWKCYQSLWAIESMSSEIIFLAVNDIIHKNK